jgi:hypothetical protein
VRPNLYGSAAEVRKLLGLIDDLDVVRFYYCYEIGSTFTAMSLMESDIVNAMLICSKVKLKSKLGDDILKWREIAEKQKVLQDSTLGSLLTILSKHNLKAEDLSYLRWIKQKRDFFVHRYFHIGCWPGEMDERHIESLNRTLRYLQILFRRASAKVSKIFVRAGLMRVVEKFAEGTLLMNEGGFDWDEEL